MERLDFADRAPEQGVGRQVPLQVNARRRTAESNQTDVRSESPALQSHAGAPEGPRNGTGKVCKLDLRRRARPEHPRGAAPGKTTEAVKFDMDRLGLDLGESIFGPLHGRAIDLADEREREVKTGVVQPARVA